MTDLSQISLESRWLHSISKQATPKRNVYRVPFPQTQPPANSIFRLGERCDLQCYSVLHWLILWLIKYYILVNKIAYFSFVSGKHNKLAF